MRLRQLGTTQSVMFLTPPEVDRSIRDTCGLSGSATYDSRHVVRWLLEQTCRVHEDLRDLYLTQGVDFVRRTDAAWRYTKPLANKADADQLLAVLFQPEMQTLESSYGGGDGAPVAGASQVQLRLAAPRLQELAEQLKSAFDGAAQRFLSRSGDALAEVEQEREVELQVEEIRVAEKPPRPLPLRFPGLHPAIKTFARTGVLEDGVFEHAFTYIGRTKIGSQFGVRETGSAMLVSPEFERTVKCLPRQASNDDFLVSPSRCF
jgi:hypothetical protein